MRTRGRGCIADSDVLFGILPGDGIKRDPDMDYIGCLGSNGQHSQILPFRVTFIVVTRYNNLSFGTAESKLLRIRSLLEKHFWVESSHTHNGLCSP